MDFSFYALLTLGCMVLLLAMWFCAASSTRKWGPDLTLELPADVLQEALFGKSKTVGTKEIIVRRDPVPSAPTELPCAPLLTSEQPMGMSKPPLKTFKPSVLLNMDTAIRVLPPRYEPAYKPVLKPVYYKFSTNEPA